jgi:very-short-patch-repair endonuclease
MNQNNTPSLFTLVQFARRNRKVPTPSEALLWARLRGRALGPRFRRQHPFAVGIIVDFYCPSYRLVVEVDGGVHLPGEARRRDAARDAWLAQRGVRVLRISSSLVEQDVQGAVEIIRAALW